MYRERASLITGARVWSSEVTDVDAGRPSGLVLPDGCIDLLWRVRGSGGELLIAGPDTRAQTVDRDPSVRWTGLRFAPGHAPSFLGVPAEQLRDRRIPLEDLWGAARARDLGERVAAAARAGSALEEIGLAAPPPDPGLARAARLLAGGRTVAEVADALGVGVRALHRRSLVAFGYSPQVLARVLRLQRAVAGLRSGLSASRVSAEVGFADQAHLTREVRTFTGSTPREFQPAAANRSTEPPSGSRTTA